MEFSDKVVSLQHPPHAVSQAEGDRHREAFRHGDDNQRDGNHQRLQHVSDNVAPLHRIVTDKIDDEMAHDHAGCDGITKPSDEFAQPVQLLGKRCDMAVVNLRGLEHLAVLRVVTDSRDHEGSVALHDLRSTQDTVGGISGLWVKVSHVSALMADGLTRERRLIDVKPDAVEQVAVGGNLSAGIEHDDVADHDVALRHLTGLAATDDLHGLIVIDLIEDGKLLLGIVLEPEGEARGKQDGDEDADRLKEHGRRLAETVIFIEGNADGQQARNQQDDDERVLKLLQEFLPQGFFLGRGKDIGAMQASALLNL